MNLWPFGKKNNQLEIKFDTEAAGYTAHGILFVTHREKGLTNAPVRFTFVGMEMPPPLSKDIFDYIWQQAERQGYTPHFLRNYKYTLATEPTNISFSSVQRSAPTAKGVKDMSPGNRSRLQQSAVIREAGTHYSNPNVVPARA